MHSAVSLAAGTRVTFQSRSREDQVIWVWFVSLVSSHKDQAQPWTMRRTRSLDSALVCSPHPSESVLQLRRLSPGVVPPAFLVCPTCPRHPVARISTVVLCMHWALLAVARSKRGSFFSPTTAFGGLPRCPLHVFHSLCRPTPVLGQSPDRSRVENPCFASNNVFVGVRVSAQPATGHKLCLAFLQMYSRPSCKNQLSKR